MGAVALWFATSRLGRALALGGVITLAIGIALLKAFGAGKAAERARQQQQSLKDLRLRAAKDAEVDGLGGGDLDRRADRWMR